MAGLVITLDRPDIPTVKAGQAPNRLEAVKVTGSIAFDASYPAGGESLTAAMLGMASVDFVWVPPNGGQVFQYDYDNAKLLVYRSDSDNASDAPLVERTDTTDLSGLTAVHFEAIGKVAAY